MLMWLMWFEGDEWREAFGGVLFAQFTKTKHAPLRAATCWSTLDPHNFVHLSPQWAFTIFCQISNQLRIVHIFVNTLGGPLVLMPLSGCTKAPTVAVLNCAKVSQPRNICPTACATYTSCLSTKSHHTWSLMAIIFR